MWWYPISPNKPGKTGDLILVSVKYDGKLPNGEKALPVSPLLVAGSGAQHNLGQGSRLSFSSKFIFSSLTISIIALNASHSGSILCLLTKLENCIYWKLMHVV